ncbi:hypothetical protein ACHAXT_009461 [Thalassiosira profunda]
MPPQPLLLPFTLLLLAPIPSALGLAAPKPTAPMKYEYQPHAKQYEMRVTSLHRYAVKGLSGDNLQSATLESGEGTFEDDRRFALLYATSGERFDDEDPEWLHKVSILLWWCLIVIMTALCIYIGPLRIAIATLVTNPSSQDNFLCAFTAPELLATLDTEYRIERNNIGDAKRLLTVWKRELGRSSAPLLGPTDLSSASGREEVSQFFTELSGRQVQCVVANKGANDKVSGRHTHQFGNTSSGVKNNDGNTRTIHIVNENTVRQFSEAVYGEDTAKRLSCTRFRPNVIVNGLEPWAEFDLIGKTVEVVPRSDDGDVNNDVPRLRFRIVSRTVRCAGVGVDPLHPELGAIDIPDLLVKHFPEHGPYLGVYACLEDPECIGGTISVGDTFRVVER